jgi:hypothetical protein
MRRSIRAAAGTLAGLTLLVTSFEVALVAGPALAHEEREVGDYTFAVGFGDEPAYSGLKNSVQLILTKSEKPVTDLGDSLQVDVATGGQSTTLSLEPDFEIGEFGTPGDYRAWFIPTRPGEYTFHFTGTVKDRQVDESFTSSSSTFDSVVDPAEAEFPVKDPTVGQVAERLDREIPRLNAAIAAQTAAARDRADGARSLAMVALIAGGVGLLAGIAGVAFGLRRR